MKKTRILIVDDHEVVRKGVAAMLGVLDDWEICAEAATGRQALEAAAQFKPDVVVMDIFMPDMNGLEATRRILKENPETEILILSMHESEQIIREVFAAGARGYVLKSDIGLDLIGAVQALRQHKPFFTSSVGEVLLRAYLSRPSRGTDEAKTAGELSPREREIVQLVAEGKSNKEVSAMLNISVKTVETHRSRILTKLNLHSTTDLVRYAIRNKITEC